MDPVLFSIDERGVATITLNRPQQLNAINMAMRDLLWEYFRACDEIAEVRAIVFRGDGRAFCAGADISEFGTAPSLMESRAARHDRDLWWELLNHRCLTIALMHGFCYGAGLELPLCCDLRIAETGATFALPEVTLGYIPSACGTQTLSRVAPRGVASHMILTGEPVDAEAALRWGIVNDVTATGGLDAALERALERTAGEDPRARRRRMVTLAEIPAPWPGRA